MSLKEFLEEYSLFRKLKTKIFENLSRFPITPINMKCEKCNSMQTFNTQDSYLIGKHIVGGSNSPIDTSSHISYLKGSRINIIYYCQACRSFTREFYIYISPDLDYCYKFGQYPEWEIKIDKNIENALGKHAKTFRKGLVCESQAYGIGAFAYYRRIIEEIIDELLDSITDLIDVENREEYQQALSETKKTRVTQEKIDLVKDLLPSILKPSGFNTLGVLHSQLSEGLHATSDECCLENATHIKEILIFLINQINTSKESAKQFTASMKSLLDKKSKAKSL